MTAAVPVPEVPIHFGDQGRRLERLSWLFLGQFLRRQLTQLLVDQRQLLLGGVGVALLDGGEDRGDFVHRQHRETRKTAAGPSPDFVRAVGKPGPFWG